MKIASKVLLILELIGLALCFLVQVGLGGACVLGTWYAKDLETYNMCYQLSYVLLINLVWYVLPFVFTIYGLVKVSHHKDGNHYLLAGILTAIFAGLIPGILMIVDASDEKVEEAEDALIEEIYGHDDCSCHHDHEDEYECNHEHSDEELNKEEKEVANEENVSSDNAQM